MKIILTGATGYVGEGVLLESLLQPSVEKILVVGRRATGRTHEKLEELVVPDFFHIDDAALTGYDACFYCAGVSAVGLGEAEYTKITYDTPLHFAAQLARLNPGMTFCHVSGRNADADASGMWQRVKGRAEEALTRLPFRAVYNFRPGYMRWSPDQRNVRWFYKAFVVLAPLFGGSTTMREVALSMIHAVQRGYERSTLEADEMRRLAA